MKYISLALFTLNLLFIEAQSSINIGTTTVGVQTLISNLDIPWEIIYGPDDKIWTTERKGIVSRIDPATGAKDEILDLTGQVYQTAESGMLGMALHPDFANTPEVFLAYTYNGINGTTERIVKFEYDGSNLINETVLIDDIQGNTTHIGCRLFILPDMTMIASTGDAQNPPSSQDLQSLSGKILRMNLDGTIPADNPDPNSYVYSFGHRNAQGIAAGPMGKIYLSEHGATTDDEFQVLEINRNYGWPNVEGFCDLSGEMTFCAANNVKEPLAVWTPTVAPSDILFYDNVGFPEFHNRMLMTVLKDKKIIAMELSADGESVLGEQHYLTNEFGRLRDICVGPNKEIYLATNGTSWSNTNPNTHEIIRLDPPGASSSQYDAGASNAALIQTEVCGTYFTPSFTLTNLGTETLVSAIITYDIDGGASSTYNWNGSLSQAQSEVVSLSQVSLTTGTHSLTIEVSNPNANTDENNINNESSATLTIDAIPETSGSLTVSFLSDDYADETYMELTNSSGSVIWSEGNEEVEGNFGTGNFPPPADPTAPLANNTQYDWNIPLASQECYTFSIYDFYGDGIGASQWGGTDGALNVEDNLGNIIYTISAADFGGDESGIVRNLIATIGKFSHNHLSVFPNPSEDVLFLTTAAYDGNAFYKITDLTGKKFMTGQISSTTTAINISTLASGSYWIQVLSNDGSTTTQTIIKR